MPGTKSSLLAAAGDEATVHMREAVILAALLKHPGLADEFETGLESLTCSRRETAAVRQAMLDPFSTKNSITSR